MNIKIIREIPAEGESIKSVEVEYNGKRFRVNSEFGIKGLQDGIEQGYLEEDLKNPHNTENYVIRPL